MFSSYSYSYSYLLFFELLYAVTDFTVLRQNISHTINMSQSVINSVSVLSSQRLSLDSCLLIKLHKNTLFHADTQSIAFANRQLTTDAEHALTAVFHLDISWGENSPPQKWQSPPPETVYGQKTTGQKTTGQKTTKNANPGLKTTQTKDHPDKRPPSSKFCSVLCWSL